MLSGTLPYKHKRKKEKPLSTVSNTWHKRRAWSLLSERVTILDSNGRSTGKLMGHQSSQLAQAKQFWQSDWSQIVQSDDFAFFCPNCLIQKVAAPRYDGFWIVWGLSGCQSHKHTWWGVKRVWVAEVLGWEKISSVNLWNFSSEWMQWCGHLFPCFSLHFNCSFQRCMWINQSS